MKRMTRTRGVMGGIGREEDIVEVHRRGRGKMKM